MSNGFATPNQTVEAIMSYQLMIANDDPLMRAQLWRRHLADMLAPYCDSEVPYPLRSEVGQIATDFYALLMAECAAFEATR